MKIIKILIVLVIIGISFSLNENRKKRSLKSLKKRVDQRQSGVCGFVGVLEVALDLGITVNGKSTNDEFQDMLPSFIEKILIEFKANKSTVFENIFKETQEYLETILNMSKDGWYSSADEMLEKMKSDMEKNSNYSGFLGLFLSYDNLKEVAKYASLPSETTKSSQTKVNGSLNLEINSENLKKYNGCIIGITKSGSKWKSTDSLYMDDEEKNKATRHWIYVTQNGTLKNWGKSGKNDIDFNKMTETIKNNSYTIITEVMCFKKDK